MLKSNRFKNTIFIFKAISFSILFLFISGCGDSDPDFSNVQIDLKIKRFEKDLFSIKGNADKNEFLELRKKYGNFYDDFVGRIMGYGNPTSDSAMRAMFYFSQDKQMAYLVSLVDEKYGDFSEYENELIKAYKGLHYYFPEDSIRDIVTYVSGFSMTLNPLGDDYTGLSLDMFMGDTFSAYSAIQPPIPQFIHKLLDPSQIVIQNIKSVVYDKVTPYSINNMRIVDEMVSWGKLFYVLEKVMPSADHNLIIGYDENEMDWSNDNEQDIWKFFIKDQLMFQNMNAENMKLFTEGPRTSYQGVPLDYCSPMIGKYTGWMMVRSYMENNPDVSLQNLIEETDVDKILKESAYKP